MEVTISAGAGGGKTWVAQLISDALRQAGAVVRVDDADLTERVRAMRRDRLATGDRPLTGIRVQVTTVQVRKESRG